MLSNSAFCFIQEVDDFFIVHYQGKFCIISVGNIFTNFKFLILFYSFFNLNLHLILFILKIYFNAVLGAVLFNATLERWSFPEKSTYV